MNIDEIYSIRSSLQNLKLLKLLHDYGVDVRDFPNFFHDIYYGSNNSWDIFIKGIQSIFTCVDWYHPYEGEEVVPDKLYWLKQSGESIFPDDLDSEGIIIILDDRIKDGSEPLKYQQCGSTYHWYGYWEALSIENGIVIIFNEDDGEVDVVEILWFLLTVIKHVEVDENEVAI